MVEHYSYKVVVLGPIPSGCTINEKDQNIDTLRYVPGVELDRDSYDEKVFFDEDTGVLVTCKIAKGTNRDLEPINFHQFETEKGEGIIRISNHTEQSEIIKYEVMDENPG